MTNLSDDQWRDKLSKEQYLTLRAKGTEPAFSGKLLHNKDDGAYKCAGCGSEIFSSEHKFDSGSGWPSFFSAKNTEAVTLNEDNSHGMSRIEVTCANCGGHLGHLFNDAFDQPGGRRFCINSSSLDFNPKANQ